jgi:hypothetical protein
MKPINRLYGLITSAMLGCFAAGAVHAQVDPPSSFMLIGHIEKFTLDTPGDKNSAAKVTVRGLDVILPRSLIITMPGGYLTAEQLFRGRDFKTAFNGTSGLALQDMKAADLTTQCAAGVTSCPRPVAEIELAGNIIGGMYIAGTARISQGGLHIGAGFIQSINTTTGFFTVGNDTNSGTTARLRLNDPEGIYGPIPAAGVVDMRFALDPGNSPIHARTGFPVCLQDAARPAICPNGNRPVDLMLRRFTCGATPAGATEPVHPGCLAHLPVPLKAGDYINYVGMMDKDAQGYFISLHGLEAELGIYTSPGVDPAYTFVEEAIQGTLGARYQLDALNTIPQEETARYKIVGFTTDPSRTITVEIYDDDATSNPLNPTFFPTRLATRIVPTNLAQLGRFKMIWAAKEDSRVVRRNVRVMLSAATVGPFNPQLAAGKFSNEMTGALFPAGASKRGGYAFGQFEAPVNEFISPENTRFGVKGWPVPVNFEDFCFLKTTNKIDTQEPDAGTGYIQVTATAVTPSPINPARPRSQQRADGTRVCGD